MFYIVFVNNEMLKKMHKWYAQNNENQLTIQSPITIHFIGNDPNELNNIKHCVLYCTKNKKKLHK